MSKDIDNQQDRVTIASSSQFDELIDMLRSFGDILTTQDGAPR